VWPEVRDGGERQQAEPGVATLIEGVSFAPPWARV